MKRAMEMYMIIAVTLMMTTLGLPQTCLHYCKFSPQSTSIPPECDCSLHFVRKPRSTTLKHIATLPKLKDSGIYYDPVKKNVFQNMSVDMQTWQMSSLNPIIKSKQNAIKVAQKSLLTADTDKSFAKKYDENDNMSSNKYKRRDISLPNPLDETKELPLHLYLDIDITSENENKPQLRELKKMIENFQNAEKNLSECINLHIYIFSKYNNTINKNTDWGRKVRYANLSSSQQLTEIESKCDQPSSIIKQSIYQIKQVLSREDKTTEITQDEQETINIADSYQEIGAQNAAKEFNINAMSSMHPGALTTYPTDDIYNNYNAATETANIYAEETDDVNDDNNLFHNDQLDMKKNDITSTPSFHEDATGYSEINLITTDPTDSVDLITTREADRTVLDEKDIRIPRIITKELSNGSLVSLVDGYEKLPNSDFITNNIISTPSYTETNTNSNLPKPNIDKLGQTDIVNIHGNLYFSFGEKQIPARFIQQSDGELSVAIDGFSMCDQMLQQDNTSTFLSALCKCIIQKNCT